MHGGTPIPYFSSPVSYQRGRGLGNLLRSLFRVARPIFKNQTVRRSVQSMGKHAARAALEAAQVALDKNDPKAFGPALKESSRQRMKTFLDRKMTGKGIKRKRNVSRKATPAKRRRITPRDIFG